MHMSGPLATVCELRYVAWSAGACSVMVDLGYPLWDSVHYSFVD